MKVMITKRWQEGDANSRAETEIRSGSTGSALSIRNPE
jgi:hypothetical protein